MPSGSTLIASRRVLAIELEIVEIFGDVGFGQCRGILSALSFARLFGMHAHAQTRVVRTQRPITRSAPNAQSRAAIVTQPGTFPVTRV